MKKYILIQRISNKSNSSPNDKARKEDKNNFKVLINET